MSLEATAREELLRLRNHTDGVTVGALARTQSLRQVLGGGDAPLTYNTLKHILLDKADSLPVTAASYSLGHATDGTTHLARLTDFGMDYGYDQRQARRYSDRGIDEIVRHIASEWTLEASPTLTLQVLAEATATREVIIATEALAFVDMQVPVVERVSPNGDRELLPATGKSTRTASTYRLRHTL